MTDSDNSASEAQKMPTTLSEALRSAREARGLDLTAVARLTSVRKDYLEALEEDRHADLPESVYVRNFVKLFAQAVGLDGRAALEMYTAERQARSDPGFAAGTTQAAPPRGRSRARAVAAADTPGGPPQAVRETAPRQNQAPDYVSTGRGQGSRRPVFATWLPSLLMIAVVVGLAVWGFNSTLFRSGTDPVAGNANEPAGPAGAPAAAPDGDSTDDATLAGFVGTSRLSIITEPPGARVLIDAFPLEGVTPISNAPVTALDNRAIRVELEGYEPFESEFDLTFNRNLSFVLAPASEAPDEQDENAEADADEGLDQAATPSGRIRIAVTDESWLEIYPGTTRSGTPLVYTVAAAGQSFEYDLPVYVHVGNAAGINVSIAGSPAFTLGSAGEVMGRVFTDQD